MLPIMVIIEGAENASALCAYLKSCYGFTVVTYDPDTEDFTELLDKIVFTAYTPRIAVLRAHLTAVARGNIKGVYFREFETAIALAAGKLILAVSDNNTSGWASLVDGYAHSLLDKRIYRDGDRITDLLEWLGLIRNAGRRSEIGKDNVKSDGGELGERIFNQWQSDSDNRETGS